MLHFVILAVLNSADAKDLDYVPSIAASERMSDKEHLVQGKASVGFAPDEIRTGDPTRSARLKWVIVVDEALPAGRALNAAACVTAATAVAVAGLLGADAKDADRSTHPGLPWAGCSVLAAPSQRLSAIREAAAAGEGMFLADMPGQAQATRVYDEYLDQLCTATAEQIHYYALSIVGPRHRVDKLVRKLSLVP
jgi:hypothetical protein